MRFCLSVAAVWLAGFTGFQGVGAAETVHKIKSVVRSDPRSGRLVRTVVVSPRIVQAILVKPGAPAPSSGTLPLPVSSSVARFVEETAQRYSVDPDLVHSVIQVESNYNPFAISPKGAQGLMQLMPGTARRFQVRNTFSPWENIEGGVRYLSYLLTLFNGDSRLALAAYNAGEGAVFKYGNVPPYPETQDYLYKVGKRIGAAKQAARKTTTAEPSKAASLPVIQKYTDAEGKDHYQTQSAP